MVNLKQLLTEGVFDKGILKAVFMAGGPGSGKTFVAKQLFGIPDKINVSVSGLKTVNSDARTDLQNDNFFNVMPMEYDEIYLDNFNTSPANNSRRIFHANGPNCTTTAFRYFIEFETGAAASGFGHKTIGVASANIGKVKGVATANIGKVIGVD